MYALTLWQPWCALMAAGIKRIENRPWMPPPALMGQRFALHAGKFYDEAAEEHIDTLMSAKAADPAKELWPQSWPEHPLRRSWRTTVPNLRVSGVIMAVATLVDVVEHGSFPSERDRVFAGREEQRRWFFGRCGWVLEDIRPIRLIPCVGRQKLWTIPAHIEQQVHDQLAS